VWDSWKRVGRKIGDLQARVLLSLFYFVILGPFALILRWRSDPLGIKPGARRGWLLKGVEEGTPLERAARQF
jgi:hypothetical protein